MHKIRRSTESRPEDTEQEFEDEKEKEKKLEEKVRGDDRLPADLTKQRKAAGVVSLRPGAREKGANYGRRHR